MVDRSLGAGARRLVGLIAVRGNILLLVVLYGEAVGVTQSHSLHYFLQPVVESAVHDVSAFLELVLALAAVAAGGLGVVGAWYLYYAHKEKLEPLVARLRPAYELLWNKYWVDEVYHALIVRPLVRLSDAFLYRVVDTRWIDGVGVNGLARVVVDSADRGLKFMQTGFAQSYIFVMIVGGVALVAWLVRGL